MENIYRMPDIIDVVELKQYSARSGDSLRHLRFFYKVVQELVNLDLCSTYLLTYLLTCKILHENFHQM